jgi:hypothetical protein
MSIIISGIESTIKELNNKLLGLNSKSTAERLVNQLKEVTPVDTGAARDSWRVVSSGNKSQITNDKDYVKELNAGSSKQAPSHFIEATILSNKDLIPNGNIVSYK